MTKVLVIEDDPAILRGLVDNLKFEGYEVHAATDGEAGYRYQQTHKPDLIVLDLMLPRMSGLELCKKLRANPTACSGWTSARMITSRNLSRSGSWPREFAPCFDGLKTRPSFPMSFVSAVCKWIFAVMRRSEMENASK